MKASIVSIRTHRLAAFIVDRKKGVEMSEINEFIKTDDWKTEKHVPVIEIQGEAKKDEPFHVMVTVGKEVSHPNKSEHFIAWISLFFIPEGRKTVYELGTANFSSHGASVDGPNTLTLHSEPQTCFMVKIGKPGKLIATSWCNIHGLWEGSYELKL
jgi:superoxide reductase